MSHSVAVVGNVEGALSSLDRARSLDPTSFIDKQRLSSSTNGEVSQSFSGARGCTVRDIAVYNGDSYSGSLRGNLPEGFGKYVWSDGCVYEGILRRGMWHGIGKISWPSRSIYEGEFSGGYIHGEGTYMTSQDKAIQWPEELRIHRRFDLKGSSLGRSADKVEIEENTILKDLDLNYAFYLEPSWRESLLHQIEIDTKFLELQKIMDYSLLLGVHYRAPQHLRSVMTSSRRLFADGLEILTEEDTLYDENYPQGLVLVPRGRDDESVVVGPHIRGSRLRTSSTSGNEEVDLLLPGTARLQIQLGVNIPARAEQVPGEEDKKMYHQVYDVVLYFGIIDRHSPGVQHEQKDRARVQVPPVQFAFHLRRRPNFLLGTLPQVPAQGLPA